MDNRFHKLHYELSQFSVIKEPESLKEYQRFIHLFTVYSFHRLPVFSLPISEPLTMKFSPPRSIPLHATVKKKLLSASVFVVLICVICVILFASDSSVLVWRDSKYCDHRTLLPSSSSKCKDMVLFSSWNSIWIACLTPLLNITHTRTTSG